MTNGDRLCPFLTTVALHWIGAMTGGVDADIRADETVIANGDTGFIEDGEVEVGKEPLADAYLFTIVATKRLVDEKLIICHMTKQALQDFLHPLGSGQRQNKPHPPTFSLSLSYA